MSSSAFPLTLFLKSVAQLDQLPPDKGAEIAFIGRSNSGKSSAINAITGKKGLAKISKTPGRTQLLNFFQLNENLRLVDLPVMVLLRFRIIEKSTGKKRLPIILK